MSAGAVPHNLPLHLPGRVPSAHMLLVALAKDASLAFVIGMGDKVPGDVAGPVCLEKGGAGNWEVKWMIPVAALQT